MESVQHSSNKAPLEKTNKVRESQLLEDTHSKKQYYLEAEGDFRKYIDVRCVCAYNLIKPLY